KMTEVFEARTVEEAVALAAKKFGKKPGEFTYEIIEREKSGILGFGKKNAKIRATVKDSAPAAVKAEPVKAPAAAPAPEAPKAEPAAKAPEAPKAEIKNEAPAAKEAPVQTAPKAEEKPAESAEDDEADYSLDNFTLIEDEALLNPKVKIAKDYITSILRAMEVDAEFTVYQNETGAVINVESNNNGTIIGRRGETLDSIQYLCSIIANKGDKDYFRITIDCLGYRKKRKETLEQLAAKVAKSVLRTGRSQPLEPMNPYERRVIHSAVSKIEGVSSRSVGEEPYRKIIISSNNPKNGGRRRNNDRRGDNRGNRRNDRRGGRREPFEPRAIDLSTSFEKDYKKPKPEDSMEGGLYGNIKL
ncbi:MAG TPA: RNA-binding cell elongation regulator Jag/EloR, partial [Ruminococcus sp.]|nr:RNA-binding cell elongation regulator Jag/EloR [Ruminococcus sp.]